MKKILALVLTLGLATGGCAWFGGDDATPETPQAAVPAEEAAAPAPEATQEEQPKPQKSEKAKADAKKSDKAKADSKKGGKSEATIAAELEKVGRKLVGQASRTVLPNKANKNVVKSGKEYVASYVEIDTANVSTEVRPGKSGQYVGFIRYQEKNFECRGSSKSEALKAPCQQVGSRGVNEMIRYDGRAWQY